MCLCLCRLQASNLTDITDAQETGIRDVLDSQIKSATDVTNYVVLLSVLFHVFKEIISPVIQRQTLAA